MKHIIWKVFYDFEKEEQWLNEMSARGLALTDYSWCRYVFEETEKNEYSYKIELLEYMPTHPESVAYLRFLEENGIEHAASYMRWVYLRKKTSEGPFDLYTDIDSKIKLYKRIYLFFNALIFIEFGAGLSNISVGLLNISLGNGHFSYSSLIIGSILMVLGFLFLIFNMPYRKKIKKLKQEKLVRE